MLDQADRQPQNPASHTKTFLGIGMELVRTYRFPLLPAAAIDLFFFPKPRCEPKTQRQIFGS
jgi:hypothetical protein